MGFENNFRAGAFVPQEGEAKKGIDPAIVNARMRAEQKEIGIIEISQETVDEIDAMNDEQFEAFIKWAVDERDKSKKRASN